jgi:hypothetical protein
VHGSWRRPCCAVGWESGRKAWWARSHAHGVRVKDNGEAYNRRWIVPWVSIRGLERAPCVLLMGWWSRSKRVPTASQASEIEAPPLSEIMGAGAPARRPALSRTVSAPQRAAVGAPASLVRAEPSSPMRLPHCPPSQAPASLRPSMHQAACATEAWQGWRWGAVVVRGLPTCGLASSPCRFTALLRATVRTARAMWPRRLQSRQPPASGGRLSRGYIARSTGSHAVRAGVGGAALWSSRRAQWSRAQRASHAVRVGRETGPNRRSRVVLPPCK